MFGEVSQSRVSDGNRTNDPHANSLAHYPLVYQGTHALSWSFDNLGLDENLQCVYKALGGIYQVSYPVWWCPVYTVLS